MKKHVKLSFSYLTSPETYAYLHMKNLIPLIALLVGFISTTNGQNYTSYFTGNPNDRVAVPSGGICLMGGATEDDHAMTWFLQQANGGDVLVLRTSGSDGYNDYLYSELGVHVNSVETIVFNDSSASNEAYIHQKIQQAEAIWFAGGNQWNYISHWRNNAIDRLINQAISNRNIVIGGTSAGMAIQGGFYFSAQNGTVTSATALSNPFNTKVTVDSLSFISNQYLSNVITDTHYDSPDRKGRHLVFLGRILVDYGIEAKGIACDEYTAVCIDVNGIAKVFGGFPTYDDNAYFIQTNCELASVTPENCTSGNPFDWNLGNEAIKVYKVKGTSGGSNTFDLNDWETGTGGVWEHWYVDNGALYETPGLKPDCISLSITEIEKEKKFVLYPNPASEYVHIAFDAMDSSPKSLKIIDQLGQVIKVMSVTNPDQINLSLSDIHPGFYLVELMFLNNNKVMERLIIK
jgi:cyanophycinase-like exopeptidase